jgi:transcription termination factor Rho
MTPVVGTALAAVAAGSLVLFSLVLQQSAFDSSFTQGLDPLSPGGNGSGISVQAPAEQEDTTGGETTVAESPAPEVGEAPAPTVGIDSFGPIPGDGEDDEDGSLVASTEEPPGDGDVPSASGGTGNSVNNGDSGPTANGNGPQATINKDPNGRSVDVTLPDRDGPKDTAPPPGGDDDDPRDDDSDDGDEDKPKDESNKNDRQKSGDKDKSSNRDKSKGKDESNKNDRKKSGDKDKSSNRDKSKGKKRGKSHDGDRSTAPGRGNDGGDDDRSREGGEPNQSEPEDRNDRHDTRRDSDEDEDMPDDDDDDDREDSHHSDDGSRGHSRARGSRG